MSRGFLGGFEAVDVRKEDNLLSNQSMINDYSTVYIITLGTTPAILSIQVPLAITYMAG